jgi:predicted nucleic acid-binding protein
LIVCDTGPLVSAINRAERRRHLFAAALLARLGREVIVPWPVLVEVDLLLRARGYAQAAITFAESLAAGVHRLATPTAGELALALKLAKRYPDSGVDIPDLIVMAMASMRRASVLTWDFRHFRSVVLRRGHHWPLVVDEAELPSP